MEIKTDMDKAYDRIRWEFIRALDGIFWKRDWMDDEIYYFSELPDSYKWLAKKKHYPT